MLQWVFPGCCRRPRALPRAMLFWSPPWSTLLPFSANFSHLTYAHSAAGGNELQPVPHRFPQLLFTSMLIWPVSCSQADSEVLYAVITLPTVIMTHTLSLGRTFHLHCYSNCNIAPTRRSAQVGKSLVALTLALSLTSSTPFWAASPLPSLSICFFFPENFLWLAAVLPAHTFLLRSQPYFQPAAQNLQCIPGKQGPRHLQRNLEPCLSPMNPRW